MTETERRFATRHMLGGQAIEVARDYAQIADRPQFLKRYGQTREAAAFWDAAHKPEPSQPPARSEPTPDLGAATLEAVTSPEPTETMLADLETPDVVKTTAVIRVPVWVWDWLSLEAARAGTTPNKLAANIVFTAAKKSGKSP